MKLTSTPIWQELAEHKKRLQAMPIKDLFVHDQQRFANFSRQANNFLYDFSKQRIDQPALTSLLRLAEQSDLLAQIQSLFRGDKVNYTEDRPALHTKLRLPAAHAAADPNVQQVQAQIAAFVQGIYSGQIRGVSGKKITQVLSLGIGGSELGPRLAATALQSFSRHELTLHFVANVDAETLAKTLAKLDPAQTICLVNSKTFTTPETMLNAQLVNAWLQRYLGVNSNANQAHPQMYAVTVNVAAAREFGIAAANIFQFWDWVGGRYSVWSAVGLPLALQLGYEQFQEFLAGAHEMDRHFYHAKFSENLPVLMALIGIWNINHWHNNTLAIIPYLDGLELLPDYLQQLEMESNGKIITKNGEQVDYATAPVIWGGVGCNGQHAYMQLLHQGSQVIPVDFLAAVNSRWRQAGGADALVSELNELASNHNLQFAAQQNLLLASCLSQSKALMEGRSAAELAISNNPELAMAKMCPGNRPSSTILFPELSPRILGNLIAWYEHKVFVQGVIWRIQSFDQWGVELGKQLAKTLLPMLADAAVDPVALAGSIDGSSAGLIAYIRKYLSGNFS